MNSPLKYHGGKRYLASRIVGLMPAHLHYVEPYAGGLSVLLAKDPEGVSEVVNDLDGALSAFWNCLMDPELFSRFVRHVEAMPFCESLWGHAVANLDNEVDVVSRGVAFFVSCRQSLAGRMKSFAPLSRTRTRKGMNEQAAAWLSSVDGLPAVHQRMKRVVVLNREAVEVIRGQDGEGTLFYLDPPYLAETRSSTGQYRNEMSVEQHQEMLEQLSSVRGKFLLSGYRSDLYDTFSDRLGWRRVDFDLPNHAAGGKAKRRMTESVWMNFEPLAGMATGYAE